MRRWTYLNTILTVNAVLLSVLVWTQLVSTPLLATPAVAQGSIPNAAEQRMDMVRAIRDVRSSVDDVARMLERGTLRTKITNIDELADEGDRRDSDRRDHEFTADDDGTGRPGKSRKPIVQFTRPVETPATIEVAEVVETNEGG